LITTQVADLAASGRDETSYFGEIGVDVAEGTDEAANLGAEWLDWAKGWNQRVEFLAATLPSAPTASAPAELVSAHRALATAIHQLRLVAMTGTGSEVPPRAERTRLFDAADSSIEAARINLSGM
jgi:hypothetical protein